MNRIVFVSVALLILPATIVAQSVVDILPAPIGAWGLDYHDGALWVGDDRDGFIYKVDPTDGSILDVLSTPYDENHISFGANHGVTWDGSGFWVAGDYGKDWLYKVNINGTPLDTIPTPTDAVGGLSWDGTVLAVSSYYPNGSAGILKVDPSDGSVLGSIPSQGAQPFGVEYDPNDDTVWNSMDDNDGDPENIWNLYWDDGTPISFFASPGPAPKGVALGGGFMWLIADEVGGYDPRIYKIDLGGGGNGDITVIPTEYDFGLIPLGGPETYSQTIRNDGDANLTLTAVDLLDPFSRDPISLPYTLGPAEVLMFDVTFDPATAGNYNGTLHIECDDVDEPVVDIPLSGTAVYPDPTINVTPSTLNFANTGVGLVRPATLTIENVGYLPLAVTNITSNDPAFIAPDLDYPIVLTTFQTISPQIIFAPDAPTSFSGTITVSSNDPDDPTVGRAASGDGIAVTFDPGEVVWSAQGIENVVTTLAVPDVTGDGIPDAVMESYDAGAADGDPLVAFWGNSHGQGVTAWSVGQGQSGGYGDQCLALSDDLDGDGYMEILRGVAWGGRRIDVRGSEDGELLWSFDTSVHEGGGWVYEVASLPDVSGDGLPEVVAAVGGDADRLYSLDGATGTQRFAFHAPDAFLCVKTIEDVNDDTFADIVAGNGGNGDDDRVYCLSGASMGAASLIWDFHTGGSVWSIETIQDVSGDGIDDVIAGSWSNTVFCINGVTGAEIWQRGVGGDVLRVETMPDVTGDGHPDVVVANTSSLARVIDGMTGSMHWSFPSGGISWSASWIPDVSGDGVPDVLVGSHNHLAYCVDGVAGTQIWSRNLYAKVFTIRSIGDVTGNGYPDVLAGTQMLSGSGGRLWCIEGGSPTVSVDESNEIDPAVARFIGPAINPMRGAGTFLIDTEEAGGDLVMLQLFDLTGRELRTLERTLEPGLNQIHWDGRDVTGREMPSGVYFYRVTGLPGAAASATGKVTLIR